MAKLIDLHVHSTASDGTKTPSELVEYAKEKGLTAFAITDHDTVDGVEEALRAGENEGIEVIPGVEISVSYEDMEIHILGMNIDYKNEEFRQKLEKLVNEREQRTPKIIGKLEELGIHITLDEVKKAANYGRIVGRPHIAAVLKEKGYVKDFKEAFEKYLGTGKSAYVKRDKLSPKEAIEIILIANGVPIMAHPGLLRKCPEETERIIKELVDMGLMGIEVYHTDHDMITNKMLLTLAKRYDLLISGGSDYHGLNKDCNIDMGVGGGNLRIDYELLEKIKKSKK